MKEQLSIKLNIHFEVSTQKVVKIKAHKRVVNGKTVKVRSHYRVIEVSRLSRLSRCLKGETPETARHFRDSGTV